MRKHDISILKTHAINKGGKLISSVYINSRTYLIWECFKGHQWKAYWASISQAGSWCPTCAGQSKPHIIILQTEAAKKCGKLLSLASDYKNNQTQLLWECSKGHQWKACWGQVQRGTWCPECSSLKTELTCKQILETELGIIFSKTRFKTEGKRYEFDGYNEEHKIAFEYHGIQHYIYPNHWHKTEQIHLAAKQRDLEKIEYCKLNNIKLLIIPFTEKSNLLQYIKGLL
jgi:hypothetical protein